MAALFADIASEITARFSGTLAVAGANFDDTQRIRWELVRRVIALDPVIDEAIGESSELRYHSPVLQRAVDGLFTALVGWRAVANHLVRLSGSEAQRETAAVLESVPQQLRSEDDRPPYWMADPMGLHRICAAAVERLIALPAESPSLRLLADKTASVLAGVMQALNGLALLVADPVSRVPARGSLQLRVPDWLPSLVNAGRAFAAIGAVSLFWIVTEWPSGAAAISFAAIIVIAVNIPICKGCRACASRAPIGTRQRPITRLKAKKVSAPDPGSTANATIAARTTLRRVPNRKAIPPA